MNHSSDKFIIEVEQYFDTKVQNVWEAITKVEHMRRWFFDEIPDFKPNLGFSTEFPVNANGKIFTHQWKVIEVRRLEKIVYDWRYKEFDGAAKVVFYLKNVEGRCLLKVTNLGLETFPQEIPEFRPESCRAGWQFFIQQELVNYLNDKFNENN